MNTLLGRAGSLVKRRLAEHQLQKIRRGFRGRCWCGGELSIFRWHSGYGLCPECGCYVNRYPPLHEELSVVYSSHYWHAHQEMKGYPPIETRSALYKADGRLDYWLNLIDRYAPTQGRTIEVGCAPGILLFELQNRGYECIGVEVDSTIAEWITSNMKIDVRQGMFPGIQLPSCDLFMAFDVMEHASDPVAFIKETARLMNSGGIAIIQTPIDRYDFQPPFGETFEAAFNDIEHLYLYTDRAMQKLAESSGLQIVNMGERLWLHHEICIFKRP